MCNRKKQRARLLPVILIAAVIIGSGLFKFYSKHPMLPHFLDLGYARYFSMLGMMEVTFAVLFVVSKTSKVGLLLLSAYYCGAVAVEIPYHMMMAPATFLVLIWTAAFIRQPSFFLGLMNNKTQSPSIQSI